MTRTDERTYVSDDMGPCTSMAIQAESDEQFMRLSYKLRRTSRLRRSSMESGGIAGKTVFGSGESDNNTSQTRQFLREVGACHTFVLPRSVLLVRDDTGIPRNKAPEACVDYLSHDWTTCEVVNSWKFIRLVRHTPATDKSYIRRLENLSWRMWNRIQRRQWSAREVKLCSGDSALQMPWLYGPLVHTESVSRDSIQSSLRASPNTVIKPILKKRNLGHSLEDTAKWRQRFGSGVAALATASLNASSALSKRIRFKSTVEQCIAVYKSQTQLLGGIEQLPTAPLNYYSDSDSDNECAIQDSGHLNPSAQEYTHYNATSHNVNTLRRYPYIYDYNSVYTQENLARYLPKDQTCDIIDIPSQLSAAIAPPPPPMPIPSGSAISTTPSMSPVVHIDCPSPQTFPDSCTTDTSLQTLGKTRDFITGEMISDAETPPATPTLYRSLPPTPTLAASFIFTSDDDSDY